MTSPFLRHLTRWVLLFAAGIALSSVAPQSAATAAADDPTAIRFIVNQTCGSGSYDFMIGGTVVGTAPINDCTCGVNHTNVNITDPAALALIGAPACTEVAIRENGSTYMVYARVEITRSESGVETKCLFDGNNNGCANQDFCSSSYQWGGSRVMSGGPGDTDGDGNNNCSDPDIDGDGVNNGADFCPLVSDAGNADTDGDGIGDACDSLVRAVPWLGLPNKPHEVYPGGTIILQGTATAGYTDAPLAGITAATWDPGDGSGPVAVNFSNPLAIEKTHTYAGADGQPYTATLTVTTATETLTDTFKVVVKNKTVDVEANMAIDKGLWYLHKQLNRINAGGVDVGFINGPSNIATTSGSVQAMQINNHVTTGQVAQDPYIHDVRRMLRWLESNIQVRTPLNVQPSGNPDTNGNGYGLFANDNSVNYIVGQVMDAFVSSGTPDQLALLGPSPQVKGRKYKDIIQDMMDFNAMSQMDHGATMKGSWHYTESDNASTGHADNSIAQWPAIGGIAAEDVWGLTTPAFVKNDILAFLPYTHDTGTGTIFSGGVSSTGSFGYGNNGPHSVWSENFATTPSALVQYIWSGVGNNPTPTTADETRFRAGLQFMARYHRIRNSYSCCDATWSGINFYGLYATTKAYRLALNATGTAPAPITMVDDDPADSVPAWHWYYNDPAAGAPASAGPVGVARAVLNNQTSDGAFPGGGQWTGNLSTAWGVIILSPSLFQLGPTAVCTANPSQIGSFGGTVNFNGSGSFHNDDDGAITSYEWSFGDGGTASTANASHTYAAGAPQTFAATLTVTDSNGLTDTTTCSVERVNTNVAPDADTGGPYTFCKGGTLILDGTGSNDEEDGTALTYEWDITAPITFTPVDGTGATFDVTAHFNSMPAGTYDIGLRVTDSLGVQNAEFSQVTVRNANDPGCNQPPVATDNTYTTNEDTPASGNVVTDGTPDSDPDAGDTLTATLVSGVSNGTLSFTNGAFTYTPNANFCGTDSFTYKVNDGDADSNVATATITVTCVNDGPTADDDANATTEDTPVSGSVTGNDSSTDVEGDTLTWTKTSDPANGSVSFTNGGYTYTPNANFCGTDSFTYAISDGTSSDAATVTITVSCVNDPPVANDNAHTTPEDTPVSGVATSSDVDGGAPAYALASGPSNGTLTFNADGTYTYTPNANYNGPDAFTFTVSDGNGGSDTGDVTINVTPVNDAPFCSAAAPSVALIWPPNHQLVNVSVLGVTDPVEGSTVTITIDSIWQDEPTNAAGTGNTPIDGYGIGTSTAQVRAERVGNPKAPGDGRFYHINFTGTDAQGGTCQGTVKVAVPHDQGNNKPAPVDGGPLYKSHP